MNRKLLFLLLSFSIFTTNLFSQEFISIYNSKDAVPSVLANKNDTIYLISTCNIGPNYFLPILYRYSIDGSKIDSIFFNRPKTTIIHSIIFKNDLIILFAGTTDSLTNKDNLELLILNKQLQILKDTIISHNYGNIWRLYSFSEDVNTNTIYGCYFNDFPNSPMTAYFLKVNNNGDIITEKRFASNLGFFIYSLIKYDFNNYYAFTNTGEYISIYNTPRLILKLDSTFNISEIIKDPYFQETQNSFKFNSKIFVSGKFWRSGANFNIGFIKTDSAFVKYDSIDFGPVDTTNFPGNFTNNVFINKDHIYVGGTINFFNNPNYPYALTPSEIQISCIDTNLNIKWQKRFKKEGFYYELWNMVSTTGGGCLLACTKYNCNENTYVRDLVVFKVDSNGTAYSVIGELPEVNEFSIYPNPTTDFINIESNEISQNASISIYNIQGVLVQKLPLNSAKQQIDVSNYINGLYLIKIINCNKTRAFKILKN